MDAEPSIVGAGRAAIIAGPTYALTMAALLYFEQVPRPVPVTGQAIGMIAVVSLIAFIVGMVLAYVPALVATLVIGTLAARFSLLRSEVGWLSVGGAIGWTLWTWTSAELSRGLPLVVTSAACAIRCQRAWLGEWERHDLALTGISTRRVYPV